MNQSGKRRMKNERKKRVGAKVGFPLGKRILAWMLVMAMVLELIPQSAYARGIEPQEILKEQEFMDMDMEEETDNGEEKEETVDDSVEDAWELLPYYGMISQMGDTQLYCNTADMNINLFSGGNFICSGTDIQVDGKIRTVGEVSQWAGHFTVEDVETGCSPVCLPDLREGIESKSDVWEKSAGYMNINGQELHSQFIKSASGIQISGTDYAGDCYMVAEDSIQYSVSSLNKGGGRIVLYSENGDIGISGSDIVIDGILAAPNGTVRINANTVTINGRIYAGKIEMSGTAFDLNASDEDMELIAGGADVVKVYETQGDFEEGEEKGTRITDDALCLETASQRGEKWEKQYNGEVETGVTAAVEMDSDCVTAGTDTIHCSITLEGKSKQLPDLGVDSYFKSYNGNLYAFINKSMLWNDAKRFCEECGGHLATVGSAEENDLLCEMANAKNSGYTAFGFSDEEQEGKWKWVTGEETVYTNWNWGEPNDAFGSGQDHAYMYSFGRWDDGYDYIQAPFFCEWEKGEGPLQPAGRDLQLVVEISGTVQAGKGWETMENEDGSTTLVYCAEKLQPFESVKLEMDIQPADGDGYVPVVQDCYYVYYDSQGKGHRIDMGDAWMPAKKYQASGSWTVQYDSGKNGTQWKRIFWDVLQAGDSSIDVSAKAYDNPEDSATETKVANNRELEGVKGRYIEIQVQMKQGQDYRSPVMDRLVLVAGKAETELAPKGNVPESEILCKDAICAEDVRAAYFRVAGGTENQKADVKWSVWNAKGEIDTQAYKLEAETPYFVHYVISEPGIYYLQAETEYEGQSIAARQRIVVRKAETLPDIEPLEEQDTVNMVLELPDYGMVNETIEGNIYFPGGEQIQEIEVLQDGEKIEAGIDGSFSAVLPGQDGKCVFDIRIILTDEREIERQAVVMADSGAPVIRIIPDAESYYVGEKAVFRIETEDISPMQSIAVSYDGEELYYEWEKPVEIAYVTAGTHILKVTGEDAAGNVAEETYEFTPAEGKTEPEQPDKGLLGIQLSQKSAAIGDAVAFQVVLPTGIEIVSVKVTMNGEEVPAEEYKGIVTLEEVGTYQFKADAVDADGNEYHAEEVCQVYDTSDKTAPKISITAPEQDAVLTDITDITGSVTDDKELSYYTVEYAKEGSSDYTLLVKETEQKEDTVLGTFDTTMLMNGIYTLKITAMDKGGNSVSASIRVSIEGNLKVGAMHIGFTDITAQMGGTTVSMNRMYDSRNKTKGDFGFGWTLGMQGMEIYESKTPLSEGYEMVKTGSLFSIAYQMTETENHDVVVTYGDGTSDRFELTFSPERRALIPISEVTLGYRCVTNQKVKLEIIGDTTAYFSGSELMFYNEEMEASHSYKLTTEDGNEIYIKAGKGVYKIADTSGNVITVDENGYHAEDGRSITFARDKEDRIIKAEDPSGNVTSYVYDDAGDLVSVTDSADRTVTFTYDKKHNLASITDPMGIAVARNEYDDDGRLIATIDADGNWVEYDYDVEGRTQTVKDRRGNATVYTYDDNGNVLQTVDAYGNKTTNSYDKNNNLLTTTDAKGNSTGYAYDDSGNVTQVTAADGTKVKSTYTQENLVSSVQMADKTVMAMEYDSRGRISSVEDANGNETTYSYTSDGKLTGLTDAIGEYQRITYDSDGNVASTTNGAGESASYTYDKDGRCTSVTISREENGETKTFTSHYSYNAAGDITESIDNAGNITKYEYDDNGNQTASVDAKGRRIAYAYDDMGNMVKTTYPDGTFETFTYDANGNNVTATDRNGLTITMVYDKLNRMTEKKYADGTKESYVYDEVGNVTEMTGTSGAKTMYTYDERYRNTAITDIYGNVTSFEYDDSARLTKRTDAEGNTTTYTYDDNGNITKTGYADGNSVTSKYDARNRVISQKDQYGNETSYTYDGADRLTSVTDAYGNSYNYGYDGNGNLVTVTDANEHVTRYSYDAAGRVKTITNALGKIMEYTYDETGNVTQLKDYAGTVTKYAYDDMDRLIEKTVGAETTAFEYDKRGQLVKVTDESGNISYDYDKYGRLITQTDARGNTLSYTYDKVGRLETFDNGFGKTTYEYDLLDRVTKVIDRNGKATLYEYDALGNRSAVRYPNGNVVTYTYDACQRLKEECIVNANGVQLSKYSYGIGKAGERTSITEVNSGVETEITYKYDKLNRLVKETIEQNDSRIINEYEYDAVSNRISRETTVKGDVSVLADVENEDIKVTEGTTTYTYNALNQLVSEISDEGTIIYTFDDNGNLIRQTGDKTVDYSYDKENHLTKATIQKGNSVTIESYTYDYAGNRTSKTINENDTIYYINDTSADLTMVVAETDKDGKETAYYTRGDELLSMERGDEVWYYLYDGHGSVRTLTNEAGRITDRYSYNAYGSLLEKEGDTENEFLYTGEQYNANTGLYYLRARYMNPATGTFISMDSYQGSIYDPVTLHKYLYAGANPVQYTDPTGYSRLDETTVTQTGLLMIGESMIFAGMVALNIYSSLRKNLVSAAMSSKCTVSVTDWKNVILGFPAHDFDTKWLITIPMALASWQLFEAIYATDEDTNTFLWFPAEEQDEEDKIHGIPAQEQNGAKIIQDNVNNSGLLEKNREIWGRGTFNSVEESLEYHFKEHGTEVGARDINQYVQKADGFRQNLRGARKSHPKDGTPGAVRYTKNGKYIILGPDKKILSYGLER